MATGQAAQGGAHIPVFSPMAVRRLPPATPGPGNLPPGCDRPLPAPPAYAETLDYETDLRQMRSLVADHACRAGLPDERASDLVLAASEIAANTLRHTGSAGTVHIWHTEAEVLCQIQDQGWITDPLAGRTRHAPDARGHGLYAVNQVCDLAELRTGRGGTSIRLHMRIRNSDSRRPSPVGARRNSAALGSAAALGVNAAC